MCVSVRNVVFCFDLIISKNNVMGSNCKEPCSKKKIKKQNKNQKLIKQLENCARYVLERPRNNQTKKQTNTCGRKGSETRKGPRIRQILLSQGFLRQDVVILSLSE